MLKDLQSRWRGANVKRQLICVGLVVDTMADSCIWSRLQFVPLFGIGVQRWGQVQEVRLREEVEDPENPELGLEFC